MGKQLSLNNSALRNYSLVLFHAQKNYLVLPLRAREDLGAMAIKEYSALSKASNLLKPHHQVV